MYDLSVCVPSIRKENWKRLYDSIVESIGDHTFELILCGPYSDLTYYLESKKNVVLIEDYGSPTRAQQIAASRAQGKYVTWGADDGWYIPGKLDKCMSILKKWNVDNPILATHYVEGNELALRNYYMNFHEPIRSPYYPNNFLIINLGITTLDFYKETGGLDCEFEVTAMDHADWGARAQLNGGKAYLLEEVVFECEQLVGAIGDHVPVHNTQLEHDQPLYASIWRSPTCLERKVKFDNWKDTPAVWQRRFEESSEEIKRLF